MSTETTNKKIKIDNGTTFGRTYTDKAIDERLQGLVSTATFTPVKEKANNSLQKPAGLTKTELVGVGTNGQENIEIGDNLTLANGKLSATGGGSGGDSFEIVELTSLTTYTGTITGTKPIIIKMGETYIIPENCQFSNGSMTCYVNGGVTSSVFNFQNGQVSINEFTNYFYHFITLTNDNDKLYLQYQNTRGFSLTIDDLREDLSGKKVICTGVIGNSDETKADPKFISGEAGGLEVHYVLKNDTSGNVLTKSIANYTIDDLYSSVE